jgi:hypothetical protein
VAPASGRPLLPRAEPGPEVAAVGTLLRPDDQKHRRPRRFSKIFGVQRSSVKLLDRTLHGMVVRQWCATQGRNHRKCISRHE